MTDLIARIDKRLTGPNPVAYHKLTPDEWLELRELIDAGDKAATNNQQESP